MMAQVLMFRFVVVMLLSAEVVPNALAEQQRVGNTSTYTRTYRSGEQLVIQLMGEEGEVVKVTVTPRNSTAPVHRYEEWIAAATAAQHTSFVVHTASNGTVELSTTAGMTLVVGASAATVSLQLNGSLVSTEKMQVQELSNTTDCLPSGWLPLKKGQAASLRSAPATGCLRSVWHSRSVFPMV